MNPEYNTQSVQTVVNPEHAAQFKKWIGTRFFSITFEKKDGTIRTLHGRLGVGKHIKGTGGIKPKPDNIVTVYERIPKRDKVTGRYVKGEYTGQYRSFDLGRIISVKVGGQTYEFK